MNFIYALRFMEYSDHPGPNIAIFTSPEKALNFLVKTYKDEFYFGNLDDYDFSDEIRNCSGHVLCITGYDKNIWDKIRKNKAEIINIITLDPSIHPDDLPSELEGIDIYVRDMEFVLERYILDPEMCECDEDICNSHAPRDRWW